MYAQRGGSIVYASVMSIDFEPGEYGWRCDLALPSWAPFRKGSLEPVPAGLANLNGMVGTTNPPMAPQVAALEHLLQNERATYQAVLTALRAYYDEVRPQYVTFLTRCKQDADVVMPASASDAAFTALHELESVYVLDEAKDGMAYTSFTFRCEWEGEHGIGIVVHGTEVVAVDYASHVLNWSPPTPR